MASTHNSFPTSAPNSPMPIRNTRQVQFSFSDQFVALWSKTATNQFRQYKTNLCQLLFPVVLLVALFGLQAVITGIIQNRSGKYTEAVLMPALSPSMLFVPVGRINCDDETAGALDTTNGRILYVTSENNSDSIGNFGGLPEPTNLMDRLIHNATLGNDFVEPNEGATTGLWANVSTPITSFVGLKGTVLIFPGPTLSPTYCFSKPNIIYPIIRKPEAESNQNPELQDMESAIYDSWFSGPVIGGYDLRDVDLANGKLSFGVLFNETLTRGMDLTFLINFITNAMWRHITNNANAYLTAAGTKNFPTPRKENTIDIISFVGPMIFVYIFHLLFPVFLQNLVFEKEHNLREIMKMMGLKTYIYWTVTYIFNFLMYVIAAALVVIVAVLMDIQFFTQNSFVSYFLLLFLWGHTMIASAFFLSVFFTRTRTAVVVGYSYVLAIGLFGPNVVQVYFDSPDTPAATVAGLSVIPPFAFYRGLAALSRAVLLGGPGIRANELSLPEYGMSDVYIFLVVEAVVLMLLAIYFEAVLPIGPGVKAHPLFFLPKRLRCGANAVDDDDDDKIEEPEDVREERNRVTKAGPDSGYVITVHDIKKVFPPRQGAPAKVAVRNLTLGIKAGECLGFLGPNGAGKSTSINILCGYLRPTSGTAYINGLDIRTDIDLVHLQMGVCPQDDCLWDDLTGEEHLRFYGRLKNLRGKELDEQVEYWLQQVNLADPKTKLKYSRQYSGGMKRRLSVAIALIGNPQLVLLDEPTTGLDPASRKSLYDVILKCKQQVSIMLTTHSMEEAEILCDRLGIFVSGRLKAIGPPADLKNRYGQFYKIVLTTELEHEAKAKKFLEKIAPGVRLINTIAGTANYEVPRQNVKLSELFAALANNKERLKLKDWAVSNTTLEEVFLKLTVNEIEDEAARLAKKKKRKDGCCGKRKDDNDVEMEEV